MIFDTSLRRLQVPATKINPEFVFHPDGYIRISGRSMFLDYVLSGDIDKWIRAYLKNPAEKTQIDFRLEYLNTINIRLYIELLKQFDTVLFNKKKFLVNWYYEEGDNDIYEKGQDIAMATGSQFNFLMITDPEL